MSNYLFTSESVSEGHPDKISDLISDTVVDLMISKDPFSRVACETLVTTNKVVIAGEYRLDTDKSKLFREIDDKIRLAIKKIGYEQSGFHWEKIKIENYLHNQSSDIAIGVDQNENKEEGAGDQGLMFGYATNETEQLMPAPIHYSHLLVQKQSEVRKNGKLNWLRPDAKSQLSFDYDSHGNPSAITAVVLSTQHDEEVSQDDLKEGVMEEILKPVLPSNLINKETKFFINPTGRFVVGGPVGDCGLTGRKIIVDTYGGMARHGGGAFSGKDPSKVDRSAAYAGRYVAKNIVAAGLADKCEVQVSYAIGIAEPTSISVNTFGTGKISEEQILSLIREKFDLRPKGLIAMLDLLKPIYQETAAYGHFGREQFPWEKIDKIEELKS